MNTDNFFNFILTLPAGIWLRSNPDLPCGDISWLQLVFDASLIRRDRYRIIKEVESRVKHEFPSVLKITIASLQTSENGAFVRPLT